MIGTMDKNKVILLEDIDCIVGNREEDTDQEKCKIFDTILNIIDGVLSPSGVIFVGTTNYIDRLDPAFIREGRFDHKICLNNLDNESAIKMCNSYGEDSDKVLQGETFPINPAYLQSKLLNITIKK